MIMDDATLSSVWSALGSTVVHFLWQGTLIGLCTVVALSCLRHRSSAARYAVASGAMLLCLLSFVGTFIAALAGPLSPVAESAQQVALAGGGSVTYLSWPSEKEVRQFFKSNNVGWVLIRKPVKRWERDYHVWLREETGEAPQHYKKLRRSKLVKRVFKGAKFDLYKVR